MPLKGDWQRPGQARSVYCPDLPGCVATGKTQEEAERNMHEAVKLHIEGMIEDK